MVAAVLMMLEGVYFVAYGAGIPAYAFIPSGSFIPSLQVSGIIAFFEGALVLTLALVVLAWPSWHRFVGVGSITLGLLNMFSGGGWFLAGTVLAYIGGVIAIYYTPRRTAVSAIELSADIIDDDPVIEADILSSEPHSSDLSTEAR
ncbi:MAG TPA: hypothetical protein VGG32_05465 [Thermoplasmata archaeon]